MRLYLPGWVCSGLVLWAFFGVADAAGQDLRLIPFPKEVSVAPGQFSFGRPLVFEVPESEAAWGRLLNEELKQCGLPEARVRPVAQTSPAFRLGTDTGSAGFPTAPEKLEGYALEVRADEVVCAAREPAGLFYGLQTLRQLIRANRRGETLSRVRIRDWPSLRWRCFQDDLTRGPSSTLDTLKLEASLGSYFKFNLMTYYMEYQFAFRRHRRIGPRNGSLTPEDLSALVEYAKPLRVDILGNQQSFGHLGAILRRAEYAGLRETTDVLTPVREETYQFLDDLYADVCPRLPFPWFNVDCDETWGLGTGPSKELADQIGVGGVYTRHIRRVHDLLRDKYQKRMMMWGDIILQHPANLPEVPKDTILLTWAYDPRANFEEQIIPFSKAGYEFFVCPGVNGWGRILPDFGVATVNIQNFVRDGARHGALGMINTDWHDDGESLKAVKWYADAWAAECAWNGSVTPPAAFNRRVGAVLFGEAGDQFGRAIGHLAQTHRVPSLDGMSNARFWKNDFVPMTNPRTSQRTASALLAEVRPALACLETCRRQAKCNQQVLDAFIFGARRMELMGQRMLDGIRAAEIYERTSRSPEPNDFAEMEQLIRTNRDAHAALGREFATLWLAESKPYALDWTRKRYAEAVSEYDVLLGKLDLARAAAAAGRPLPSLEEVGLAGPEPRFRRVRPLEILPDASAADTPWADNSATHRMKIVVGAGDADRFDLPVEIEVALPAELIGKPVRAFIATTEGAPREALAQLNALADPARARLVLVLSGPCLKGEEVSVHVYFGLTKSPGRLPGAVRTWAGAGGGQWLENDRIRLLLGKEGAHVYRWEIIGSDNRDLTVPGESDWTGFCDLPARRQAPYNLDCKARGPAMVEYQCGDLWGHTKTIRLYGGASWIEVFLSEPASSYWNYDNPTNFAGGGPTPGTWLFSDGRSGPVGREADGAAAQVKAPNTYWSVKHNSAKLALGLITPETAAQHVIGPGGGFGGVGIEQSPVAEHFVTFAGMLQTAPGETMTRLQTTLDLRHPVSVRLYSLQARSGKAD
jgi:hexosaminidase